MNILTYKPVRDLGFCKINLTYFLGDPINKTTVQFKVVKLNISNTTMYVILAKYPHACNKIVFQAFDLIPIAQIREQFCT
jgi:hypothetical protein